MRRVLILSLKRNDYLSDLYQLLNDFNISSSNLLKSLKDNKPFTAIIKDDKLYDEFIKRLENIANFQEEKINKESLHIDRWSLLTILILDIFTILVILEVIFKNVDIYNILLNIFPVQTFSLIFTLSIKLFLVFTFLKGILGIYQTTLWSYIFKLRFTGKPRNLLTFMMLPVFGFYMLNLGFGVIYQYFGFFMIIFFFVSIFTAYEHIDINFERF